MTAAFTRAVKQTILDRAGDHCEVCGVNKPVDIHHRIPRGAGGSKDERLGQPSNGLAICRPCHDLIESRREFALDRGWLIHRGWSMRNDVSAADVPVIWQGDWALLSDDGHVFTPPQGRDRCERCGLHTPTQGHRRGCQLI